GLAARRARPRRCPGRGGNHLGERGLVDQQACIPSRSRSAVGGRGDQGQGGTGVAGEESGAPLRAEADPLGEATGNTRQVSSKCGSSRVLDGAPDSLVDACPAVAQAHVGELRRLCGISQALGQCVLEGALALQVTGGDCGKLSGPGDTRGPVAPARPSRSSLERAAGAHFGDGDVFGPPGACRTFLAPGVEPGSDGGYGVVVAVHADAATGCLSQEEERTGDAVGDSVVAVSVGEAGRQPLARIMKDPPAGSGLTVDTKGAGERDEVVEDAPQSAAARGTVQQVGADSGQSVEHVVLAEPGQFAPVYAGCSRLHAAVGQGGDMLVHGLQSSGIPCRPDAGGGVEGEGDSGGAEIKTGGVGSADLTGC